MSPDTVARPADGGRVGMILIWRGWGIVVVGIALAWTCVAIVVGEVIHADRAGSTASAALCLIPAGVMTWFVGRRMNRATTRLLIDPVTGGEVRVRREHSLFFLRVEWWGPIMVVVGAVVFVAVALSPIR
jgi:hypothetical protein